MKIEYIFGFWIKISDEELHNKILMKAILTESGFERWEKSGKLLLTYLKPSEFTRVTNFIEAREIK